VVVHRRSKIFYAKEVREKPEDELQNESIEFEIKLQEKF
jgi:hypothetical protein